MGIRALQFYDFFNFKFGLKMAGRRPPGWRQGGSWFYDFLHFRSWLKKGLLSVARSFTLGSEMASAAGYFGRRGKEIAVLRFL